MNKQSSLFKFDKNGLVLSQQWQNYVKNNYKIINRETETQALIDNLKLLESPVDKNIITDFLDILIYIYDEHDDLENTNFGSVALRLLWDKSTKEDAQIDSIRNIVRNYFSTDEEINFICSKPYDFRILDKVYNPELMCFILDFSNTIVKNNKDSKNLDFKHLSDWIYSQRLSNDLDHLMFDLFKETAIYTVQNIHSLMDNCEHTSKLEKIIAISMFISRFVEHSTLIELEPTNVFDYFKQVYPVEYKQFKALNNMSLGLDLKDIILQLGLMNQLDSKHSLSLPELT